MACDGFVSSQVEKFSILPARQPKVAPVRPSSNPKSRMTVFHTRTTTVLTTPMCLDRDDLLDDCTDRKKRLNDEEEFILVDGKKFTPTEVEKWVRLWLLNIPHYFFSGTE